MKYSFILSSGPVIACWKTTFIVNKQQGPPITILESLIRSDKKLVYLGNNLDIM